MYCLKKFPTKDGSGDISINDARRIGPTSKKSFSISSIFNLIPPSFKFFWTRTIDYALRFRENFTPVQGSIEDVLKAAARNDFRIRPRSQATKNPQASKPPFLSDTLSTYMRKSDSTLSKRSRLFGASLISGWNLLGHIRSHTWHRWKCESKGGHSFGNKVGGKVYSCNDCFLSRLRSIRWSRLCKYQTERCGLGDMQWIRQEVRPSRQHCVQVGARLSSQETVKSLDSPYPLYATPRRFHCGSAHWTFCA